MPWKVINPMDAKTEFVLRAMRKIPTSARYAGNSGSAEKRVTNGRSDFYAMDCRDCPIDPDVLRHLQISSTKIRFVRSFASSRHIRIGVREDTRGVCSPVLRGADPIGDHVQTGLKQGGPGRTSSAKEEPRGWYSSDSADRRGASQSCMDGRFQRLVVYAESTAVRAVDDPRRLQPLHSLPRALASARTEVVREEFQRIFEQNGLPEIIRSDNGAPFAADCSPLGLTRLSAWWLTLGINLDRIRPGKPQENGAHERMHRDIACEVENAAEVDLVKQQASLDVWVKTFNNERPHESLGMKFPREVYAPSSTAFDPHDPACVSVALLRAKSKG